ncbi:MAG: hypothetical protein CM15mP68_0640 [Pseudomonadota bacterium]|nr:MAG: hypothetical protein CM15mP68_0640 [Pseudomonadota bacterium]
MFGQSIASSTLVLKPRAPYGYADKTATADHCKYAVCLLLMSR